MVILSIIILCILYMILVMRIIKKLSSIILSISFVFCLNFNISRWWIPDWRIVNNDQNSYVTKSDDIKPQIDNTEMEDIQSGSEDIRGKLLWLIELPKIEDYSTSLWYVMSLIQVAINRVLWILSFISLIYMLYCGFLVFSSWSDDKNASKWKKWISTAAIALAWIGLSRLIVSAMIWLISNVAWNGL